MGSILGNIFGATTDKSADETLAFNAIASTAASANAYLAATLEATTPEVRRLFAEYTTQSVMANEVLNNLAIKKGWVSPYETPVNQLQSSVKNSQLAIGNMQ
jgi:spore coat protein CotF